MKHIKKYPIIISLLSVCLIFIYTALATLSVSYWGSSQSDAVFFAVMIPIDLLVVAVLYALVVTWKNWRSKLVGLLHFILHIFVVLAALFLAFMCYIWVGLLLFGFA